MFVLITYDVATTDKAGTRRLRRVAQVCKDFGQRVQNSVFECKVDAKSWVLFRTRLLKEIKEEEDSLRIYFLETDTEIEHFGTKGPVDFEAPLII